MPNQFANFAVGAHQQQERKEEEKKAEKVIV